LGILRDGPHLEVAGAASHRSWSRRRRGPRENRSGDDVTSWDADRLRQAFTAFFVERGHTAVPSAGLIPHDPRAPMFTNAGMNQFIPYFLGEEVPAFRRATTVQRCVRIRGKHDDIELIGRTGRHLTFFEMLGNFSFGDYFKADAIGFAWSFLTGELGLDPERLWVTVHDGDDEAAQIWSDEVGVPPERIQRMGDDNFWEMGETGPCGPCSELYYDRGEDFGAAGGPAKGGEERYVEIWNLVFMQYDRDAEGHLNPLPRPNIDTGAGLERILTVLQDVPSVWETNVLRSLIGRAEELTGHRYGSEREVDVALRILADHARAMAFLVSDGVFPSNEGRGYVLRRIIRRAVLRAYQLGSSQITMPLLLEKVVEEMGGAYPKLSGDAALVEKVVGHEEEAFRRTLRQGTALLEEELSSGIEVLPGDVAFRLHDTFGFPIDLTTEIARERGVEVDREGFAAEMGAQRARARAAARGEAGEGRGAEVFRSLLDQFGPTRFVGYQTTTSTGRVLAVLSHAGPTPSREAGADGELFDVVLDSTPFYAEGGGQVGDTGELVSQTGRFLVLDTNRAVEGITRHVGVIESGELLEGSEVEAVVDADRRAATRRNHTGTHLLHWALRSILGEHVKQQGSLVGPDRLRFDFSHFGPLTPGEIEAVEDLVNAQILTDAPVNVHEMSRKQAEEAGAIAFFGEKYGELVRVVEAGPSSVELCGGTHVASLGQIGTFRIVSEVSIGANTRRIEATTGWQSIAAMRHDAAALGELGELFHVPASEVVVAARRLELRLRQLEAALAEAKGQQLRDEAVALASGAKSGVVVARRDGLDPAALRELALEVRSRENVHAVGLVGSPGENKVSVVVALDERFGADARAVAGAAARAVGGGGGGTPQLATAGGRDVAKIDDALVALRAGLGEGVRS
jgi:alanyl-tRNA synthetase